MPTWLIFILFIAGITLIIMVIEFLGNKIVDKGSDAIHRKQAQKYNESHKNDSENLADRFK